MMTLCCNPRYLHQRCQTQLHRVPKLEAHLWFQAEQDKCLLNKPKLNVFEHKYEMKWKIIYKKSPTKYEQAANK